MQQPNRGGFRAQQGPAPGTIRTKKYQLDKDMFTKVALGKVWRREWWFAMIPFVLLMLPAVFSFSWWWVAAAVIVTILFVAIRSAQIVGVTRVEQGNVLFEKMTYEIDSRQIIMKRNEREGMTMTWDMIEKAERSDDAFLLWLQPPTAAQLPGGWKGWVARTFQAPVFLHLPYRIFVGGNDVKLMESLLRRKNLLA